MAILQAGEEAFALPAGLDEPIDPLDRGVAPRSELGKVGIAR